MRLEELERLIRQGETEEVEFQSSVPTLQVIARNLTALANTNGGVMILGVKEPGEIVGVDEQRARAAIEEAQRSIAPPLAINVHAMQVQGRPVVVAQVAASEELHAAMGGYFGRSAKPTEVWSEQRADTTRPLAANEILLHARKGKTDDAALSRLANAVAEQTRTIEKQRGEIRELRQDLADANALWIKVALVVAGAVAGAMLRHFIG